MNTATQTQNMPAPARADQPHILVVDDDARLRDLLGKFLSDHGFVVVTATDARTARSYLEVLAFDLIVLDLMMPGESGLDFSIEYRQRATTPILMLTAMGEAEDRIKGLESGADDYLVKPFEPRELLLRINNILRRTPADAPAPGQVQLGEITFDRSRDELVRGSESIRLTSVEASLLRVLAENPGTILSRDELMARTGMQANDDAPDSAAGGRTIDVQVTRLRRKIEANPKIPRYLQTVRGKGYVLKPD